jgi:hypothetical protein
MTLCFLEQELENRMQPDASQKDDMDDMFKNLETMLTRMR